jgi:4-hydroxyphenylpyruvate dioxygenase
MATTTVPVPHAPADDRMPVHGIDHVEFYVGNAAQAAYFFTRAYGFTETAYAGLETGRRDRVSHVLEQGRIRLVLTGTLMGDDDIAAHHPRHGDGVHKIALSVPDAAAAYEHAVAHGARGVHTPRWVEDEHGRVSSSSATAMRGRSCLDTSPGMRRPRTRTNCC